MKDSGHPRDPRMGGEFRPQLALQETGKSRQGPSEDHSAFLRDVQVLADRSDPAHHLPRGTKEGSEGEGDLPRLFGGLDVRARRDFDERNPKPVQAIDHLALRLAQLPRRVLLQEDGRYADSLPARLEMSVQGDEGGSLETRGVRTIDHDLPHEVDFARALRFE